MDDYKKYVPCFDLPSTSTFGADVLMTDVVDIEVERSNSLHWFVTCPLGGCLNFVCMLNVIEGNITRMQHDTGLERQCQFRVDPFQQYCYFDSCMYITTWQMLKRQRSTFVPSKISLGHQTSPL